MCQTAKYLKCTYKEKGGDHGQPHSWISWSILYNLRGVRLTLTTNPTLHLSQAFPLLLPSRWNSLFTGAFVTYSQKLDYLFLFFVFPFFSFLFFFWGMAVMFRDNFLLWQPLSAPVSSATVWEKKCTLTMFCFSTKVPHYDIILEGQLLLCKFLKCSFSSFSIAYFEKKVGSVSDRKRFVIKHYISHNS